MTQTLAPAPLVESQSLSKNGELIMANDLENDFPSDGEIYMNWLSTAEAVEYLKQRGVEMTLTGVIEACKAGRLRCKKLGSRHRGEWRVDPKSLDTFEKYK
jgi:hypothetical protein